MNFNGVRMNDPKNCKQIALNLILLQLVAVISVPVVAILHDFAEFKLQQRVRFLLHSCFSATAAN